MLVQGRCAAMWVSSHPKLMAAPMMEASHKLSTVGSWLMMSWLALPGRRCKGGTETRVISQSGEDGSEVRSVTTSRQGPLACRLQAAVAAASRWLAGIVSQISTAPMPLEQCRAVKLTRK